MDSILQTLQQDLTETESALRRDNAPQVHRCLEQRRDELVRMIARLEANPLLDS